MRLFKGGFLGKELHISVSMKRPEVVLEGCVFVINYFEGRQGLPCQGGNCGPEKAK